jgi:hypothetical protein
MPLLDHFNPPLHGPRRWEGFHHSWATVIAQQLNQETLPPDYFAEPEISLGPEMEIDVATMELTRAGTGGSKTATAVWSPGRPKLSATVDFSRLDSYEICGNLRRPQSFRPQGGMAIADGFVRGGLSASDLAKKSARGSMAGGAEGGERIADDAVVAASGPDGACGPGGELPGDMPVAAHSSDRGLASSAGRRVRCRSLVLSAAGA